jgi:hypothetical protein
LSVATVISEGFVSGRIAAIIKDGFASYTGLPEPPAAGYQYETCSSTSPPAGGLTLETGQSPAVAIGDVFTDKILTSPSNFTTVLNGDGTIDILASGNTSRQEILYGIYRVSGNTLSTGGIVWINEVAPTWSQNVVLTGLPVTTPMTPINLATYASSSSGDVLTFAIASGSLPPGITLSGGILSGTATAVALYTFVISATDSTGTSTNSATNSINVIAAGNTVPNTVGLTLDAAISAYQTAGYTIILVQIVNSVTIASGLVVAQTPVAGTVVPPTTVQIIYLSMGPNKIQETNL